MENENLVLAGPNARLNITINGQNGDYPDPVSYDATDGDIRQIATEAIHTGYIPGIASDPNVDLADFVVDRFPATEDLPPRLMVRPKVPFGYYRECPRCKNGHVCGLCYLEMYGRQK